MKNYSNQIPNAENCSPISIDVQNLWKGLARSSYAFYVEYVHGGLYRPSRHTSLICNKLEEIESGELDSLIICLPPRHSKSMSVSETFPSWFICKDPNRRVIEVSYGDRLAKRFGRLNKQKIQLYSKDLFDLSLSGWGEGNTSMTDWGISGYRGGMLSSGIGGSITGEGADLLIIDDPVKNRQEAESLTYREMVWSEWQNTLVTRLTPKGRVIVIVTRWHEDDLVGRLLKENSRDWYLLSLPALAREDDLLGRAVGEPLWPEYGFDIDWARKTRLSTGSRAWEALYQQNPTAVEGTLIKREWFRFYRELPPCNFKVQSWDTAFKKGQENDYTACGFFGVGEQGYYLTDMWRDKVEYPELKRQMVINYEANKPNTVIIEDTAAGQSAIQELKRTRMPIKPVHPTTDKISRVNSITPILEAGLLWLPEGADWVYSFIEECCSFPNGFHDDQVDVLSQALEYLRNRQQVAFRASSDYPIEEKANDDPVSLSLVSPEVENFQQRYSSVHYFDTPEKAASDGLLLVCKEQGYVPLRCLLGGQLVLQEVREGRDPCMGCECDRSMCNGRKKVTINRRQ